MYCDYFSYLLIHLQINVMFHLTHLTSLMCPCRRSHLDERVQRHIDEYLIEIEHNYRSWPEWYAMSAQPGVNHKSLEAVLEDLVHAYLYDLGVSELMLLYFIFTVI